MSSLTLDVAQWADQQFGACDLGDKRRTKRLVKLAVQVATKPDAATPEQTESWADCKATYRLVNQDEVTFDAVIGPHCELTRAVGPGTWLVINDTTEINFGRDRELSGVGRVGSNQGRGFFLHTAMIVGAERDEVIGLAAQELYLRPLSKVKRVSSSQRKQKRKRETDVWGRVIDRVSRAPKGAFFIHVCDRGADNFDVFCHLLEQQSGWVIRAAQLKRRVRDDANRECSLEDALLGKAVLGSYELRVSANRDQPARTAHMEIRSARIVMPRPKTGISRYVRDCGVEEIPMVVVETREVNPPPGVKPMRWVLLTSEAVQGLADAWRIIRCYEKRPLVEEYHKCLKTGCSVEARQYRTGKRLAPIIGLLSVVAVRLLQLKMVARQEPERPAAGVVPTKWLAALPRLRKIAKPIVTVRDFFRGLACLGGFLGRKSDGEPGWQTVWRGLEKLLHCLRGAELIGKKCG
jgi:Transposase DNA-binding/Transposase Tn5 dimerisation domain